MNVMVLLGTFTANPELLKATDGSWEMCKFTLAEHRYIKRNGVTDNTTNFFDCKANGGLKDVIMKSCRKGTKVIATGAFEQRKYQTANGEKRSAWSLNVHEMQFVGSKPESDDEADTFRRESGEFVPFGTKAAKVATDVVGAKVEVNIADEDIPF